MRRLTAPALCAAAIAAPIPAAHADSAPEVAGDVAAKLVKKHLKKVERREARARQRRYASVPIPSVLYEIAECESGGNPRAIGGGGLYRGLLQFDQATWESTGGQGDPIEASPKEQLYRGAILYARAGTSPWPVCGG